MKRTLVALLVVSLLGGACASITDIGTLGRHIEMVAQRTEHDCGLAALAMLLGEPYERVDRTRVLLQIPMDEGLYAGDVIKLAATYHVALVFVAREPNAVTEAGIVVVQPLVNDIGYAHAVYLYRGYVYDPYDATAPIPYVMAYVKWTRVYYFLRQVDPL